jgi:hypothetical protein
MNVQGKFHLEAVIPSIVGVENGTNPSGKNESLETIPFA